MQADDVGKPRLDGAEEHVRRRTLRVEPEQAQPPGTLRVEPEPPPAAPGTLRVEPDEASPTGTRRVEQSSTAGGEAAAASAARPHVRILAEVEPGTLLFEQYTVIRTLQEHEHDQPGIYISTDTDGRTVVVKVHPRDFPPDPEVHSRLPSLRHPNVIRTFASGERDGYFFEAQEYCAGGTVQARIPPIGGPLAAGHLAWLCWDFLPQVQAGLKYMHESGIVHRDVKPSNIYIREGQDGDYVLGDFDISSILDPGRASRLTQRTWLTLEYAAPEQFPQLSAAGGRLAARVSQKSDYWSLGITLIELLVGTTTLHQIGPELVQGFHMKGRRVDIPDGLPENAALLLRGLLIRDDELRWGGEQVSRWLKRQTTAADRAQIEQDVEYAGYQSLAPYRLEELAANDLHELAQAMVRKPGPAMEDLLGGEALLNWVAQHDANVGRDLRHDRDRWRNMPEVALQCALLRLDPRQPYVFADGATAYNTEQWVEHAEAQSRAQGKQRLELAALDLLNQLAIWLKLKDPAEPELAQEVLNLAGYPPPERAAEVLFLLQPARPLHIAEGLEARTPEEFAKLAYGKPEDWRLSMPACYKAAQEAWQGGLLAAWLRQRGNKDAAFQCHEAAKAMPNYPAAGFETALRLLQPALPKVRVVFDRRAIPRRLYVPYGDVRVVELRYRTEGPGVPFGALVQVHEQPGVSIDDHLITQREGKFEVRIVAGADTVGTRTYRGKLRLESGVAELVGGPLPLVYRVGFPHFVTLARVLIGALAGALLLGFPRLIASLMGLGARQSLSALRISRLWNDAVNMQFHLLNLVVVALLLALAVLLGWTLWTHAVREAEP